MTNTAILRQRETNPRTIQPYETTSTMYAELGLNRVMYPPLAFIRRALLCKHGEHFTVWIEGEKANVSRIGYHVHVSIGKLTVKLSEDAIRNADTPRFYEGYSMTTRDGDVNGYVRQCYRAGWYSKETGMPADEEVQSALYDCFMEDITDDVIERELNEREETVTIKGIRYEAGTALKLIDYEYFRDLDHWACKEQVYDMFWEESHEDILEFMRSHGEDRFFYLTDEDVRRLAFTQGVI